MTDKNKTSKQQKYTLSFFIFAIIVAYSLEYFALKLFPGTTSHFLYGNMTDYFLILLILIISLIFYRTYTKIKNDYENYHRLYAQQKDISEKSNLYKLMLEYQEEGACLRDKDDIILITNQAFLHLFDVTEPDCRGKHIKSLFAEKDFDLLEKQLGIAKRGEKSEFEFSIPTTSSKQLKLLAKVVPVFGENNEFDGTFTIYKDSSALREAEGQLSKTNAYFRALIESIPNYIWLKDIESRYIMANNLFVTANGKQSEIELIGKSDADLLSVELANKFITEDKQAFTTKSAIKVIHEFRENHSQWYETIKTPVYDANNNLIGLSGITSNITERKAQEDLLYEIISVISNKSGQEFFDSLTSNICSLLGASVALVGRYSDESKSSIGTISFYKDGTHGSNFDYSLKGAPSEKVLNNEICLYPHNVANLFPEDTFLADANIEAYAGVPLHDSNGVYIGILVALFDYELLETDLLMLYFRIFASRASLELERIISEEELIKNEAKYSEVINQTADGISIINQDGIIIEWNNAQTTLTGISKEEALGKYLWDIMAVTLSAHEKEPLISAIKSQVSDYFTKDIKKLNLEVKEFSLQNVDGTLIPVETETFLISTVYEKYLVGINRDLRSRKEAEAAVVKARDFYLHLFENFPVMVWMTDYLGDPTFYNKAYLDFRGKSIDEELTSGWEEALQPHKKDELLSRFNNCFYNRKRYENEYELLYNDGTFHWILDIGHPFDNLESEFGGYIGVCFDLSEQKLVANKVAESEERYRNIVENISDVVYRLTLDGTVSFITPVITSITGYTVDEVIGRNLATFIHPDDLPSVLPKVNKSFSQPIEPEEFRIRSKYSQYHWVRAQAIPLIENGIPIGTQGIITDIDRNKRAEEALRESEERFKGIFKSTFEGIILADESRKIIAWNTAMETISGYKEAEVISKDIAEIHYTLLPDSVKEHLSRATLTTKYESWFDKNKDTVDYRSRKIILQSIDGKHLIVERVSFFLTIGKATLMCAIFRDVTKEHSVEQDNIKFKHAIEQSPNNIIITDTLGKIVYANPAFEELTGYSSAEVLGRKPSVLRSGDKSAEEYKILWETISRGEIWRGEFCNRKKNGELYWEIASIAPVRNSEGEIISYIAVKEDITDRKKIEEELVAAKDKAEEMNMLKTNFLANMSHELRTPMIGILGYSTMLKDEEEFIAAKFIGETIYKSGNRLLETLNLILDFSRLEAQKIEISIEPLQIISPVNEVLDIFKHTAHHKNIHLLSHINDPFLTIKSDEKLFRHIFSNIVNNAVKYTQVGGVDVYGELIPSGDTYIFELRVVDTGIGISKENQQLIFEEFRQVSEGFSRSFEGTGLGLTLARRFVEKLKGKIWVESDLGVGSTFFVHLPTDIAVKSTGSKSQTLIEESAIAKQHKILLVENDPVNAEVIGYFVSKEFNTQLVTTGEEALSILESEDYDLILMDINLGQGMNGMQVTQKLRAISKFKDIPIIAITAFAMKGDKEEFLAAGCSDYLAKPFSKADLHSKIWKYISA